MTEEAAVRREAVPMSVLIVDDEQSVRETCATVAAQSGMNPIAVATAEEAFEVLEHSAVDILLTDLKLPRTTGVELLKLVHDHHPEVAVVVLTQYGTIESASRAARARGPCRRPSARKPPSARAVANAAWFRRPYRPVHKDGARLQAD